MGTEPSWGCWGDGEEAEPSGGAVKRAPLQPEPCPGGRCAAHLLLRVRFSRWELCPLALTPLDPRRPLSVPHGDGLAQSIRAAGRGHRDARNRGRQLHGAVQPAARHAAAPGNAAPPGRGAGSGTRGASRAAGHCEQLHSP